MPRLPCPAECIYSRYWAATPRPISSATTPSRRASVAQTTDASSPAPAPAPAPAPPRTNGATAFSTSSKGQGSNGDDAKLIFGAVFSLRNMVRKLGGDDDAFISYRTAQYKLHYYETASNLRFVMLTETGALSMRNVLHQIYINLWVEYVVKNPLAPVEHHGGAGVRNEMFELGLDRFIKGLM
jgi:trafficking protein particle complex subunit 1